MRCFHFFYALFCLNIWKFQIKVVTLQPQSFRMTAETAKNIVPIIRRYFETQPVEKAWLFGSFARGEETPKSDVDMLVQLDNSQRIGLKFFGMIEDLKDLLGRPVDLISDPYLKPFARESADKDKILIYEREK